MRGSATFIFQNSKIFVFNFLFDIRRKNIDIFVQTFFRNLFFVENLNPENRKSDYQKCERVGGMGFVR